MSNSASASQSTDAKDPLGAFSIALDDFRRTLDVNVSSMFMALAESVKGFETLKLGSAGATFIYTGNYLKFHP